MMTTTAAGDGKRLGSGILLPGSVMEWASLPRRNPQPGILTIRIMSLAGATTRFAALIGEAGAEVSGSTRVARPPMIMGSGR